MPPIREHQHLIRAALNHASNLQTHYCHCHLRLLLVDTSNSLSDSSDAKSDVNGSTLSSPRSPSSSSSISSRSSATSSTSSSENDAQSHTDSASPSTPSSAVSTSMVNHIETWSTLHHHHFQSTHHIRLFLHHLVTTHVLFPHSVSKCSQLALVLNCYKEDNPQCFHHNLRVSPHAFNILLSLIEDHSIFYNQSNVDQLLVSFHLAIPLHWFGTFGNSASVDSIAQWAGCSPGTIINSTWRWLKLLRQRHGWLVKAVEHGAKATVWWMVHL